MRGEGIQPHSPQSSGTYGTTVWLLQRSRNRQLSSVPCLQPLYSQVLGELVGSEAHRLLPCNRRHLRGKEPV